MPETYSVTITETLKMTVTVTANNQQQAEQMVSDGWHSNWYILGAEDFIGVEFEAVPADVCRVQAEKQGATAQ